MRRTVVLNVVGLTPRLLGRSTPHLEAWARGGRQATIEAVTPAVTCSAQATYLTGVMPDTHGIVANGWYFRDEDEVKFWRQSNRLVQAPKVWEIARELDPRFTCANLFWWYNMASSVDVAITPRPMYPADGRKIPDLYTTPPELRHVMQDELGRFPLFDFWGPKASIASSRWIAESAKRIEQRFKPTLSLVYLPHLDYNMQRLGPIMREIEPDLQAIDAICGELIDFYESHGVQVIVLSEYGITPVHRPVSLNRVFRQHGLITVRDELGRELLDTGASAAFAVADHQLAHIYINDPAKTRLVRSLLEATPGVERVLDDEGKREYRIDHPRAGELVAVAAPDAWFTYYYWLDDAKAPDYARTVDIHRKPGYDPVELFVDPAIRFPTLKVGWKLLKKALGFRTLMDVIPLEPSLVRGSHGRPTDRIEDGPLLITRQGELLVQDHIPATDVFRVILKHLKGRRYVDLPASLPA